jgi:hypothetical protein
MADESTLDKIKDLAHHAYDAVSGTISAAMAPRAPTPAQVPDNGLANQAANNLSGRQKQIDDAVDAAAK